MAVMRPLFGTVASVTTLLASHSEGGDIGVDLALHIFVTSNGLPRLFFFHGDLEFVEILKFFLLFLFLH